MTVFPTPVGVFPIQRSRPKMSDSLPHARGGVSKLPFSHRWMVESSPRPWGCFWREVHCNAVVSVFPTPVGVFLNVFW